MDVLSRQETPEFAAFKKFVTEATDTNPNLVRLDCLNPVKPDFDLSHPPAAPLFHLWREYLSVKGKVGFLSRGVRHSLQIIFEALKGRTISIPKDVYPVYKMIADKAGVEYVEYPTQPGFMFLYGVMTDTVLLTAPHVPAGKDVGGYTVEKLVEWLAEKPSRRLIIDRVYDFANSDVIQPLVDTNQVFVCYSLSKTHLSPLVSGFTICPTDFAIDGPECEHAPAAKVLLTRYADYPSNSGHGSPTAGRTS